MLIFAVSLQANDRQQEAVRGGGDAHMADVLRIEADPSDTRIPTGRITARSLHEWFDLSAVRARQAHTRAALASPPSGNLS